MKSQTISVAIYALVLGIYGYSARSGVLESISPRAEETYYNLQVRGFQAARLEAGR